MIVKKYPLSLTYEAELKNTDSISLEYQKSQKHPTSKASNRISEGEEMIVDIRVQERMTYIT